MLAETVSASTEAVGLTLLIPANLAGVIMPDYDDRLEQAKGIYLEQTLLNQRTLCALYFNIDRSVFVDGHKIEGQSLSDLVSFTQKLRSFDRFVRLRNIGVAAAQDVLSELVAREFIEYPTNLNLKNCGDLRANSSPFSKLVDQKRAMLAKTASASTKEVGLNLLIPANPTEDIMSGYNDRLEQAKGIDLGQTLLNQRTLGALESNIGSSEYFVDGHKIEGHSLFDLVSFTQKLSSLDRLRRIRQIGVGAAQDILSELVARRFIEYPAFLSLKNCGDLRANSSPFSKLVDQKRAMLAKTVL